MWIAKPISQITKEEQEIWLSIEADLPLAQTLTWARATQTITDKTFLIFSPDERVGGIVFCLKQKDGSHYECTNGPHLNWEVPSQSTRQLATFASAVLKIDPHFQSLVMRPRWLKGQLEERKNQLPIPISFQSESATLVIPVQDTPGEQFALLTKRLKRTLNSAWLKKVQSRVEVMDLEHLQSFYPNLKNFSLKRGFVVPPKSWFSALLQNSSQAGPNFWLITAGWPDLSSPSASLAQILICERKHVAHYLFGFEIRHEMPSALSISAIAHWEALLLCQKRQIANYDLNGQVVGADKDHVYFGVSQFKSQFAGKLIEYESPEFVITQT